MTAGGTCRRSSQSTSGGPLVLVVVVSRPARSPTPSVTPRDGIGRPGTGRRRTCSATAASTPTPTASCSAALLTTASTSTPATIPGTAARVTTRTSVHRTAGLEPRRTSRRTPSPSPLASSGGAAGRARVGREGPFSGRAEPVVGGLHRGVRPRTWWREGGVEREGSRRRAVRTQQADAVLGVVRRREGAGRHPPQRGHRLGRPLEPRPAPPHDVQVPAAEDVVSQRLHVRQTVRLTMTPWLSPTSQPNA